MDLFIFQFDQDECLIDSYLEVAAVAHGDPIKDRDWFRWKFQQSPYGETLLACAKDGNVIAGCVALGIQDFYQNGQRVRGAISYDTFVNPQYQGHGLFKKLIVYAEEEAKRRGIEMLLNFPNNNSLPGFLRMGWTQTRGAKYYIKANKPLSCMRHFRDLKKSFEPNPSNIEKLDPNVFLDYQQHFSKGLIQDVSADYLKWRFLSYPISEYVVVNDDNVRAVARLGHRGRITELQIIFMATNDGKEVSLRRVIKLFKRKCKFDLIGVPTSMHCSLNGALKRSFFLSVPNRGHECFKLLSERKDVHPELIDYQGIMAHTY